jgi:hypothetical protein
MLRTIAKSGGQPLDVAGAAVEFRMRPSLLGQGPTVAAAGQVLQVGSGPSAQDRGMIGYSPAEDDVAVAGTYRVEWHVTLTDGQKPVFPSEGYDELVLEPAL